MQGVVEVQGGSAAESRGEDFNRMSAQVSNYKGDVDKGSSQILVIASDETCSEHIFS